MTRTALRWVLLNFLAEVANSKGLDLTDVYGKQPPDTITVQDYLDRVYPIAGNGKPGMCPGCEGKGWR